MDKFLKGSMRGDPQPPASAHSMVNMWPVKTVPKAFGPGGGVWGLSADSWMIRSAAWTGRGNLSVTQWSIGVISVVVLYL